MTTVIPAAVRRFAPPDGVAVRGTVYVLPGRGEHAGVYERFGRRLAVDGYLAVAVDEPAALGRPPTDEDRAALVGPVVLAGSDTGALWALALAAAGRLPVAGVVLAGLPTSSAPVPGDWDAEIDSRTACPVHRDRLGRDTVLRRGALGRPVPAELLAHLADAVTLDVPALVLHGADDRVAPVEGARRFAAGLRRAEVATVGGGRHDVLNDVSHRIVAAHVVQWLERLRGGAALTVESVIRS